MVSHLDEVGTGLLRVDQFVAQSSKLPLQSRGGRLTQLREVGIQAHLVHVILSLVNERNIRTSDLENVVRFLLTRYERNEILNQQYIAYLGVGTLPLKVLGSRLGLAEARQGGLDDHSAL
jgi:hypothetical protein